MPDRVQKLRSVQALRALAACAVVVLHAYPDAHAPIGNAGYGAAGVDLFFVISGFIMAQVAQGPTAGQFLGDRLWRIYPLWWIAVLPWLFMVPRGLTFVASSLTLWPIYGSDYYVPVLKVGWTLSFELMFYAGMTLAIVARPAGPLAIYVACLIGALATSSALLHFTGSPMALEFLMGVVVAKLPRRTTLGLLVPWNRAPRYKLGNRRGRRGKFQSAPCARPRAAVGRSCGPDSVGRTVARAHFRAPLPEPSSRDRRRILFGLPVSSAGCLWARLWLAGAAGARPRPRMGNACAGRAPDHGAAQAALDPVGKAANAIPRTSKASLTTRVLGVKQSCHYNKVL